MIALPHTLQVDVSDALMRRALKSYFLSTLSGRGVASAAIAFVVLIAVLLLIAPGRSIWFEILVTLIIFGALLGVRYFRLVRNTMRQRARLSTTEMNWILSEQGITLDTELANHLLKWPLFLRVRKYQDYWLLFIDKHQFLVLPLADTPPDVTRFIEDRISRLGGHSLRCGQCGYLLRGQREARCPECGKDFPHELLRSEQDSDRVVAAPSEQD